MTHHNMNDSNGMYAVHYMGWAGTAHGIVSINDGKVTGNDIHGGVYGGTCNPITHTGHGPIPEFLWGIDVYVAYLPGTMLVNGTFPGMNPLRIFGTFPQVFWDGHIHVCLVAGKPIATAFKKL